MIKIKRFNDFVNESSTATTGIEILIPSFEGYNNTMWGEYEREELLDWDEFESVMGHAPEHLDGWAVDWNLYNKLLGNFYVNRVKIHYGRIINKRAFDLKYERITMPKDYTYQTNELYATLTLNDATAFTNELIEVMKERKDIIAKAIADSHSSKNGYMSRMSNDFDQWLNEVRALNGLYIGYALYYAYCAYSYGANTDNWDKLDKEIYEAALEQNVCAAECVSPETKEARDENEMFIRRRAGFNESLESDTRKSKGMELAKRAKNFFAKGDLENAGKAWTELYNLYTGVSGMDAMLDMHSIMCTFTDDEVYGITNYLMCKS